MTLDPKLARRIVAKRARGRLELAEAAELMRQAIRGGATYRELGEAIGVSAGHAHAVVNGRKDR